MIALPVGEEEGRARGFWVPAECYCYIWSIMQLVWSMTKRKLFGLFQYHCASVTCKLIANHEIQKGFYIGKGGFDSYYLYMKQHFLWSLGVVWFGRNPDSSVDFSPDMLYFSCYMGTSGTCLHSDHKDSHCHEFRKTLISNCVSLK